MLSSQNLIRNGSFENISPPQNWNNWSGEFVTFSQTPSQRVLLDWDEHNSADLLTSSCTHTWSGVPVNKFGYLMPKDGNNVVGIQVFPNSPSYESKEYVFQQLTYPLQAGKIYCLSFYVSKADRKEYAIKNIGAFFSNSLLSTGSIGYINALPQVINQSGFITDTVNWVQIQGCFTANGNEQYITIGNFNSNANTDTLYTGTNNPIPSDPKYAYYYIDDITLIDQSTVGVKEDVGFLNEVVGVSPNPSNRLITVTSRFDFEKIELLSVTGQTLLSEKVIAKTRELNLTDLSEGIYFVKVSYANGLSTVKKVVKQ